MTCPSCGVNLTGDVQFCSNCGASLSHAQPTIGPVTTPPPTPAPVGPQQTSGKAIISLVCGIINVFPLFVVAIIFGHLALSEIKKSAGRLKGEGLAIAGLVMGYLGIVAIPFILIVAAIAIPNLLRAKISANEASAVGSVRTLVAAEINYSATHPNTGFTCDLSDLTAAGLIDSRLASGQRHGYTFSLQNCMGEKEGAPISKFQMTATPVTYNSTGVRAFCADESGVFRQDREGSAQYCLNGGAPVE